MGLLEKNVKAVAMIIVSLYVIRKQECVPIANLDGRETYALTVCLIFVVSNYYYFI
jgi:hypothetical protein